MQLDLNVAKPAPALLLLLARRSIACTFAKLPPPPFDVSKILFLSPPTSHAHAYKSAHPHANAHAHAHQYLNASHILHILHPTFILHHRALNALIAVGPKPIQCVQTMVDGFAR